MKQLASSLQEIKYPHLQARLKGWDQVHLDNFMRSLEISRNIACEATMIDELLSHNAALTKKIHGLDDLPVGRLIKRPCEWVR